MARHRNEVAEQQTPEHGKPPQHHSTTTAVHQFLQSLRPSAKYPATLRNPTRHFNFKHRLVQGPVYRRAVRAIASAVDMPGTCYSILSGYWRRGRCGASWHRWRLRGLHNLSGYWTRMQARMIDAEGVVVSFGDGDSLSPKFQRRVAEATNNKG